MLVGPSTILSIALHPFRLRSPRLGQPGAQSSRCHRALQAVGTISRRFGRHRIGVADRTAAPLDWRYLPGTTDPEPFDDRIDNALDGFVTPTFCQSTLVPAVSQRTPTL